MALTQYAISRRWRLANPERSRAHRRKSYWKQREKWIAQNKAWKEANQDKCRHHWRVAWFKKKNDPVRMDARRAQREKYRAGRREIIAAQVKAWCERNPERVREYSRGRDARRTAREYLAPGTCSRQQWLWRFQFYGGHCAYCPRELRFDEAQMEHRIPLSRGGSNWPANIVPACADCNQSKGTKTSAEFGARIVESK